MKTILMNICKLVLISLLVSCQQRHEGKNNQSMNDTIKANDEEKSIVKLENSTIVLHMNLNGGSYIDFHIKEQPLNPLNFLLEVPPQPPYMGHFLCFDRWGPPTESEKTNGFTHHGEANLQVWKMLDENNSGCTMKCSLPMGGLELIRDVKLSDSEPVFFVTEKIKNLNKYGRMFNIVQHVTIAPPFLTKSTIFDNNTEKGFENKEDGSLNQEETILNWPVASHNGEKISLRHFDNAWPRVTSFTFSQDEEYGWVTACNPKEKLMLGYIWKTEEYPWINFWRSMDNGLPIAFGMEFGTTGFHEPFPIIAKKGKIFGRNIYDFIDANEELNKSFIAFLAKIPEDYKGVEKVEIKDSFLNIKEKGRVSQDITYKIK